MASYLLPPCPKSLTCLKASMFAQKDGPGRKGEGGGFLPNPCVCPPEAGNQQSFWVSKSIASGDSSQLSPIAQGDVQGYTSETLRPASQGSKKS